MSGLLALLGPASTLDRLTSLSNDLYYFVFTDSSSWSTARAIISSLSVLLYIVVLVVLVKIIKVVYSSTQCCFKLFRKEEKEQIKLSEYVLK